MSGLQRLVARSAAAILSFGLIGLAGCDDPIRPERALTASLIRYQLLPGDTIEYRIHNMSGEAVIYDPCQSPRLERQDSLNHWSPAGTLPPPATVNCAPVTINDWDAIDLFSILPATVRPNVYRVAFTRAVPASTDDGSLPVLATPAFTILAPAQF